MKKTPMEVSSPITQSVAPPPVVPPVPKFTSKQINILTELVMNMPIQGNLKNMDKHLGAYEELQDIVIKLRLLPIEEEKEKKQP